VRKILYVIDRALGTEKPAIVLRRRAFGLVAGARNHRNLPVEILTLFSQDAVRPFDAAA
jgi:hypothetical protein